MTLLLRAAAGIFLAVTLLVVSLSAQADGLSAPKLKTPYGHNTAAGTTVELNGIKLYVEQYGKMAQVARNLNEAMEIAMRAISREDLICITGSFYLVAEAMKRYGVKTI